MYLRLITILGILALSDATFLEIAKFFGKLFGIDTCPKLPEPISTDETSCGVRPTTCDASYPYRSYDGSCNNLKHPWWGMPYTPYKRLLNNAYSDGVHKFPKSSNNKDLPNARAMSVALFPIKNKEDVLWTLGFMQYGQITAHDMGLTADVGQTGIFVACCLDGQYQEVAKKDPRCAPIKILKDDPFYSQFNWTCINFYRTQTTHDRKDCKHVTKVAEPLTSVTGFIDVSYLYGSSKEENDKVREFKGGLLKFDKKDKIEYPPQISNPTEVCSIKKKTERCFLSGDIRVNQNPQLAVLHCVYLTHHNYVARELGKLNPHWDDEKIFQVARKISIAIHQNIFYNELLYFLLGSSILVNHKVVYPGNKGYVNDYDPTVNPTPSSEFSHAAFKVAHSAIQTLLILYNENRFKNTTKDMTDWMLKPGIISKNDNFRQFCRGLATQPQSAIDKYFTPFKQELFKVGIIDNTYEGKESDYKPRQKKPGDDLMAVDIFRGRDHGLPPYAQYVVKCCLGKLETWEDAEKFFSIEDILLLKTFYHTPKDIELVVGVALEKLLPVALTGPVSACIIADQFYRTRVGDRFFYQNEGWFTKGQLKAIINTNFGDLLCLTDGITEMQPRAMQQISLVNPLLPCSSRTPFDFSQWKEDPKDCDCDGKKP